ncbi:MAG: hypothetical protein LUC33_03105 [Prevotellaceae bacterium]|nr:hypothetical protein [Prevotellaceae bacterium]
MRKTRRIISAAWRTAALAVTLLMGSLLLVAEPKCDAQTWRWIAATLLTKAGAAGLLCLAVWLARRWNRRGALSLPESLREEEEEE